MFQYSLSINDEAPFISASDAIHMPFQVLSIGAPLGAPFVKCRHPMQGGLLGNGRRIVLRFVVNLSLIEKWAHCLGRWSSHLGPHLYLLQYYLMHLTIGNLPIIVPDRKSINVEPQLSLPGHNILLSQTLHTRKTIGLTFDVSYRLPRNVFVCNKCYVNEQTSQVPTLASGEIRVGRLAIIAESISFNFYFHVILANKIQRAQDIIVMTWYSEQKDLFLPTLDKNLFFHVEKRMSHSYDSSYHIFHIELIMTKALQGEREASVLPQFRSSTSTDSGLKDKKSLFYADNARWCGLTKSIRRASDVPWLSIPFEPTLITDSLIVCMSDMPNYIWALDIHKLNNIWDHNVK